MTGVLLLGSALVHTTGRRPIDDREHPAGWYPDPSGGDGSRWWDGTTWTEHVHPPTPAGTEQTHTTPATPADDRLASGSPGQASPVNVGPTNAGPEQGSPASDGLADASPVNDGLTDAGSPQPRSTTGAWIAAAFLFALFAIIAVAIIINEPWSTTTSADAPSDEGMPGEDEPEASDERSEAGSDADSLSEPTTVTRDDADAAALAAGCALLVDEEPLEDRSHFDLADAPPLDEVYTDGRPTHSGPHTAQIHPVTPAADRQIDEFVSTHNLEHGSIIVWYDPDQVSPADAAPIAEWAEALNGRGFLNEPAGVGILTSPYDEPGISSGGAIALRAWGSAMDCDRWDEQVGDAFVAERFGTRGIGPEKVLAPYPDGVLELVD